VLKLSALFIAALLVLVTATAAFANIAWDLPLHP
jgi:hypothetical protein